MFSPSKLYFVAEEMHMKNKLVEKKETDSSKHRDIDLPHLSVSVNLREFRHSHRFFFSHSHFPSFIRQNS